jgi:hypothetical protein
MDQIQQANYSDNAMKRYKDAYIVARATSGLGGTIKVLGWIFGGIVAIAGWAIGLQSDGAPNQLIMYGGLILGAIIAIPLWVLGILITAQGEIIKAALDEAVHTSPFLNNDQRASVMSL